MVGLKPYQLTALERLYRRRVPPEQVITTELATAMCEISCDINRQIGIFIDRRGQIEHVIVGDAQRLFLPDIGRQRAGAGRLRGIRLIHTHLRNEDLTQDDLTDLSLLSLDFIAAITLDDDARPALVHAAHLLPENAQGDLWSVLPPEPIHRFKLPFDELIRSLESEFARKHKLRTTGTFADRAIVVHVDSGTADSDADLEEVIELCATAGVSVLDVVKQSRRKPDPKYLIGKGKLDHLMLHCMQLGSELVIFTQDLTPSQARAITDACELKVLDRTQLILDIFSQHAKSGSGKLQVELAQLHYMLPRLVAKNTGLSRLTGGIGGRGPGETKLEINRRRAKDRIRLLEQQLDTLCKTRAIQRQRRVRSNVPTVSIVGYTNAGKSTLLNTLTHSNVIAEDKLFATLDPSSRRLRFPEEKEIIITDTVGFIRDLPESLVSAFKATLEELEHADILLHVIDASSPRAESQMDSVTALLRDLHLNEIPQILAWNKSDLADPTIVANFVARFGGVSISAVSATTTLPLLRAIGLRLWEKDMGELLLNAWPQAVETEADDTYETTAGCQ